MKRQHTFDFTISRWIESWYNTRKNFKFLDKVTRYSPILRIYISNSGNWKYRRKIGIGEISRKLNSAHLSNSLGIYLIFPLAIRGNIFRPLSIMVGDGGGGVTKSSARTSFHSSFLPSFPQIFHSITDLMANRFNCIHGGRIIDFSRFSLFNPSLPIFFSPSRKVGEIFHPKNTWKLFIRKLLNLYMFIQNRNHACILMDQYLISNVNYFSLFVIHRYLKTKGVFV